MSLLNSSHYDIASVARHLCRIEMYPLTVEMSSHFVQLGQKFLVPVSNYPNVLVNNCGPACLKPLENCH